MNEWFESSMVHALSSYFSGLYILKSGFVAANLAVIKISKWDLKTSAKGQIPFRPPRLVDHNGDVAKRWFIIFYVWDPEKKVLVRKRLTTGLNDTTNSTERYRRASIILSQIQKKLKEGLIVSPSEKEKSLADLPLQSAMQHVLDQKKNNLSQSWIDVHKWVIGLVEKYFQKSKTPVKLLKVKDFAALMDFIQKNTDAGPKTLNEYHSIISTTLKTLVNLDEISVNYMERIAKKRVAKGHANIPFTLEEVGAIKSESEKQADHQFTMFIQFLLYTLGRPGKEIRMLQVKDIRPTTIWIPIDRGKTGGRSIDIAPGLEKIIVAEKLRSYPADWFIFGSEGTPGPEVRKRTFFRDHFQFYLKKTGLLGRGHTLYGFKHTGAIQAVIAGVDILAIQNMIGHKTLAQTQAYLINIGAIRTTRNELEKLPQY